MKVRATVFRIAWVMIIMQDLALSGSADIVHVVFIVNHIPAQSKPGGFGNPEDVKERRDVMCVLNGTVQAHSVPVRLQMIDGWGVF